jgi:ABC-type sugar transport system ATPase subunit
MPPVLKIQAISKHFPGVQELQDVSFDVEDGAIHAVMGENGAGKSTLMHRRRSDASGSAWDCGEQW